MVKIPDSVVKKIYAVRHSLRGGDKRRDGQTRMGHYLWYARKLGFTGAVKIIKRHIRNCKNLQINTDSEDVESFLSYDLRENQVAQARDNAVGMDVQDNMIRSPDLFTDEVHNNTSPSAHASLIEQLKKRNVEKDELQRRLAVYEGQAVGPQPDSVVPDVK
uniref:Uncharacterized protein n=1 Tax=Glossina pallidipes TaxID=7398 RepID=A0A1B0A570_GLOPL